MGSGGGEVHGTLLDLVGPPVDVAGGPIQLFDAFEGQRGGTRFGGEGVGLFPSAVKRLELLENCIAGLEDGLLKPVQSFDPLEAGLEVLNPGQWRGDPGPFGQEGIDITAGLAHLDEQVHGSGRNPLDVLGTTARFQLKQVQDRMVQSMEESKRLEQMYREKMDKLEAQWSNERRQMRDEIESLKKALDSARAPK